MIDITQHLPADPAPPVLRTQAEDYAKTLYLLLFLYPSRRDTILPALDVCLTFIRKHRQGRATVSNYADMFSIYRDAQEAA